MNFLQAIFRFFFPERRRETPRSPAPPIAQRPRAEEPASPALLRREETPAEVESPAAEERAVTAEARPVTAEGSPGAGAEPSTVIEIAGVEMPAPPDLLRREETPAQVESAAAEERAVTAEEPTDPDSMPRVGAPALGRAALPRAAAPTPEVAVEECAVTAEEHAVTAEEQSIAAEEQAVTAEGQAVAAERASVRAEERPVTAEAAPRVSEQAPTVIEIGDVEMPAPAVAADMERAERTAPPRLINEIIREPKSEKTKMPRIVKCGLIQTSLACDVKESLETIRNAQIERTLKFIDQAGQEGVQILCMQEIFTGPYFCAEQNTRWYDAVELIPDGPTTRLMQEYAKKYNMVIIVPIYEEEEAGIYYNTAAVIDADGTYLGKYRKNHIPHTAPGFWEKFYFRPGNLGYPTFKTQYAQVGVYICYDRHFPEGARELGLNGAEIVFNPSATVAGLSEYLWKLEQPAHAVANGYFVGAINRVGYEAPWNIGEFYGQSYFCDPRGQFLAQAKRDEDALVTAELDLDKIREVRHTWQFYRDRRPETYGGLVRL